MNAAQLYTALVGSGKPCTPDRLRKAQRRADDPAVYAEVYARLVSEGHLPKDPA